MQTAPASLMAFAAEVFRLILFLFRSQSLFIETSACPELWRISQLQQNSKESSGLVDMFTYFDQSWASSSSKSSPINKEEALASVRDYVHNFLAKPNVNIGRKGPTCPFVPGAIKRDTIFVSVVSNEFSSSEEKMMTMLLQVKLFATRDIPLKGFNLRHRCH